MNNPNYAQKYPVTQKELEKFWEDGLPMEKWNSLNEEEQEEYTEAIMTITDKILEDKEEEDLNVVPSPVLWSIHKEPMTENIPFTHLVMCPRFPGSSPVVQALLDTTNIKREKEEIRFGGYGDVAWWGNLVILYALDCDNDQEASADFKTLDVALTRAISYIMDDFSTDKPIYVDIPYFQAVNENNERVDWMTTCEFIVGIFEREVNKIRINQGFPTYQIILGFWDRF